MYMKHLNWLELVKRIYLVLWGTFIVAMILWMFNLVVLESKPEILVAAVPIIAGSVIGPWILLKIARWVYAGLNEKRAASAAL